MASLGAVVPPVDRVTHAVLHVPGGIMAFSALLVRSVCGAVTFRHGGGTRTIRTAAAAAPGRPAGPRILSAAPSGRHPAGRCWRDHSGAVEYRFPVGRPNSRQTDRLPRSADHLARAAAHGTTPAHR